MSYTGRQDFGDGEGNLLDHVKAFADYYLHTEEAAAAYETDRQDNRRMGT